MLHTSRRYGGQRLSFERPAASSKKNPGRTAKAYATKVSQNGEACPLCLAPGHTALRCPVPIDPAMPKEGPIGTIGCAGPVTSEPAKPLAKYRGGARVIVLPPGVHGDELEAYKRGELREARAAAAGRIATEGKKPLRFGATSGKVGKSDKGNRGAGSRTA